ncbi:uncharacterized protein hemgn isoform X4 [Pseudoliparis swirei]|uniref:uncharacterized protein hemgn isoform X4 n=1 Tax=Pseudoliparis swirei TaxID=2059687 RepID=UPI0024BDF13F|nr:uncharacterized protein hemgn isoform X4 [Pseudoliparis swirei]
MEEKQESAYKHSNEDQGGIHHRLRDRNLLRKRKAEAEEKETNQVESQRKKHRAESSTKRRGRPKKSEPTPEISVIQEEAAVSQEVPVVAVPEPTEVDPDQTPALALAAAPLQVETIFTEAQCREAHDQVLIKDLGSEEEGDISSSQDKRADDALIGTSSYNIPDPNKMFSIPTVSLTPPPQKYFPGNVF